MNCPNCGTVMLNGVSCNSCGHRSPNAPAASQAAVNAARQHYLDNAPRGTSGPKLTPQQVKAMLATFGTTVAKRPRAWATRIIERHKAGQHVGITALEMAREAYRPAPTTTGPKAQQREPGCDDE